MALNTYDVDMNREIKKLSIIIPCYNEENTIELILNEIDAVDLGEIEKEVIVVDDYSQDATRTVLSNYKNHNVKVILQGSNQGKGAALKRGFLESTGDLVIVQDADREYDPRDYLKLLIPFQENRADVVFGSRFSGGGPRRVVYLSNTIGNKLMTRLSALLSGLYVSDIHTCYIMFDGELIRAEANKLVSARFGFNPEIVARLARRKDTLQICEVGISYYGRSKEEGKKIRFRDGLEAIWEIIRFNLL